MLTYNGNIVTYGGSWVNADPLNPLGLPSRTMRVLFEDGYTPTSSYGTFTQVSSAQGANIWDFYRNDGSWTFTFNSYVLEVLGANTSTVYGMARLFNNCQALRSVALFDTSNVTNMSGMFKYCYSLPTIPLFDTSRVKNFSEMFLLCRSLATLPQLDTSSATNMSSFLDMGDYNANTSLTSLPQLDLSNVTNASHFCYNCRSLATVPTLDVSSATNLNGMFNGCYALTTAPATNTVSATTMSSMYYHCRALTSVPLLSTDVATNVNAMFCDCPNVQSGALALYNQMVSQATPPSVYSYCFTDCGSNTVTGAAELAQIPSSWGGTGA